MVGEEPNHLKENPHERNYNTGQQDNADDP